MSVTLLVVAVTNAGDPPTLVALQPPTAYRTLADVLAVSLKVIARSNTKSVYNFQGMHFSTARSADHTVAACAVTVDEYQTRRAFRLLQDSIDLFINTKRSSPSLFVDAEFPIELPGLDKLFTDSQDPEDKLDELRRQIEAIRAEMNVT